LQQIGVEHMVMKAQIATGTTSSDDVTPAEGIKLCIYCNRYLPIEHFRRRRKNRNERRADCRDCCNEIAGQRRQAERTGTIKEFLVAQRRAKSENQRDLVFGLFIQRLGGTEGFVHELVKLFEDAKENGDPNLALRIVLTLVEAKAAFDVAKGPVDYDLLSDEDLERTVQEQIRAVLDEDDE
jgi:hypothetical protein